MAPIVCEFIRRRPSRVFERSPVAKRSLIWKRVREGGRLTMSPKRISIYFGVSPSTDPQGFASLIDRFRELNISHRYWIFNSIFRGPAVTATTFYLPYGTVCELFVLKRLPEYILTLAWGISLRFSNFIRSVNFHTIILPTAVFQNLQFLIGQF